MSNQTDQPCSCEMCEQHPRSAEATEHKKINRLVSGLDEKQARRAAGLLADMRGHGGVAQLAVITGMSRTTIAKGQRELLGIDPISRDRVRRPGGGRKQLEKKDHS